MICIYCIIDIKVLNSICNKTDDSLVGSVCCSKKYPYYDMVSTKMLHHKETGKQYEHYVVGFDPNDDIDYKRALRIVNDIALHFKYNQSFFAIHNNTEHLHAHVIMNTVDCFGKRFRQWKPQLNDFKAHVNQICQRNKIAPIRGILMRKPSENEENYEIIAEEIKKIYGGKVMKNTNDNQTIAVSGYTGNNNYYYNQPVPMGYYQSGMDKYFTNHNSYPAEVIPSSTPVENYQTVTVNEITPQIVVNIGDSINISAPTVAECSALISQVTSECDKSQMNIDMDELMRSAANVNAPVNIVFGRTYNVILSPKGKY